MILYILILSFIGFIIQNYDPSLGGDCFFQVWVWNQFEDNKTAGINTPVEKFIPNRTIGRQQKIPYNIFQTNEYNEVPWKMKYSISTIIEKNPEFNYRYFNSTDRRNLMDKYMGPQFLACYDKLMLNAYKADLFRLSAVYIFGGCYIDISYCSAESFITYFEPHVTFMTTLDGAKINYALNAAFFCATPQHQVIYNALMRIVQSVKNQDYGSDSLDVTGPRKLAQGFKDYYDNRIPIEDKHYSEDNFTVLRRTQTGGCLSSVFHNLKGQSVMISQYPDYRINMKYYVSSPHYSTFYNNRSVYNSSIEINLPQNYSIPKTFNIKPFAEEFSTEIQKNKE